MVENLELQLIDKSPDYVVVLDADLRVTRASEGLRSAVPLLAAGADFTKSLDAALAEAAAPKSAWTLAWTGVWLTAASAVTFGAAAGTTEYLSVQSEAAKLTGTNNADFLQFAGDVGPVSASVSNAALYVGAGLLVVTVGLFFLPHEELARVDVSAIEGAE